MKDKINLILIFFVIIISRLPFIWNSPGIDPDNWLVLETGKQIAETGIYSASRLPGYPISEYLASSFGNSSWLILNVISVIFTAFSCVIFYEIIDKFKVNSKILTTLAFGFLQSVFIASTSNMEYTWSLFFLLLGLWILIKGNLILSGVAIGLMISTRFTNIIFLLPILYFLYNVNRIRSIKKYILFFTAAALTFILIFFPVFSKYSFNIFPDVGNELVSFKSIFSQYTLHIYGLLGTLGLSIGLIYIILKLKFTIEIFKNNRTILIFSGLMILITTISYLKYPYESYYNLPLIPFVILILAVLIQNYIVKRIIFTLFILSPFLLYVSSNKFQIKGAIFINEKMENDFLAYTKSIHKKFITIPDDKKLLVIGGFHNCYLYNFPNKNNTVKIYKRPTKELLKYYKSKGYAIYYPVSVEEEISTFHHYDISEHGQGILNSFSFDR